MDIVERETRYERYVTIIPGSYGSEELTFLKKKLGCGGKLNPNSIEIQGKHKNLLVSFIKY